MARYTDAVCRLCRRFGMKLYLKGERCFSPKCAFEKRPYPPGARSQRRRKVSDRGLQLREKQKARFIYGLMETQFRRYYEEAKRRPGVTGDNLLLLLETRLDNAVYRLGFADSRNEARQTVRHGHIAVNGRTVNIPSYQIRAGDAIGWTEQGKRSELFAAAREGIEAKTPPAWLSLDKAELRGRALAVPTPDDVPDLFFNPKAIVEYYSR
ncbi:MAG TPA: 30S ribosomal protein S4 [Dehalococcoidia bacterium]|nr:30S ribosomal protein S4 [Dehalococcoidia bacterium]